MNEIFKESETMEGLNKSELKEFLSLANKDLHFIFDETLYEQIDGVTMRSPTGSILAYAFLVYEENK